MRILLFVVVLVSLSGCTGAPQVVSNEPPSVHFIHRYHNPPDPDFFDVPPGAGLLNVTVILENFYRNRCPAPIAEIKVLAPDGATYASLKTQNLPLADCVYTFSKNETTLAPGRWSVRYSGGSEYIGSIVDVRRSNVSSS